MSGKSYFFCGIGGSGMSPLASILAARGARVLGSDRAHDRGESPEKFAALEKSGITLFPQDGSGLLAGPDSVVVSSAIEPQVPDIAAALAAGIPVLKRAEVLAELFNASETGISVAGTSGKSTTVGMLATILVECGLDPAVMNGGIIRNFEGGRMPGNMRAGHPGGVFVTETDESDGSIALFNPGVAVLNNIALDHKPIGELEVLFGDFVSRAGQAAVLNMDDPYVSILAHRAPVPITGYGIDSPHAHLKAGGIRLSPGGVSFTVLDTRSGIFTPVNLNVPGRHNVLNALAALGAALAAGVTLPKAAEALESFRGIARRFEVTGVKNNITVIDDFGHNPDKIAATLKTLKGFEGRIIIMFQPHGFGPLKLMGREIAAVFVDYLDEDDMLLMPEPYYAGGTADRSVSSRDVIGMAAAGGVQAHGFETRDDILPFIESHAKSGDRIVIMGARDDTLSDFARRVLARL